MPGGCDGRPRPDLAAGQGRVFQRGADQRSVVVGADTPTDDLPCAQVHHLGQATPPFIAKQMGPVGDPDLIAMLQPAQLGEPKLA